MTDISLPDVVKATAAFVGCVSLPGVVSVFL